MSLFTPTKTTAVGISSAGFPRPSADPIGSNTGSARNATGKVNSMGISLLIDH